MSKKDKLDILALAAHPDDVELCCSGTVIKHIEQGYKVGIVDFTAGELGSRGNAEIRLKEAENAKKIMGVSVRENLGFADGFFENDKHHQLAVIRAIRKYKPDIVLANAVSDRHPDHGRAADLAADACFLSGLRKIKTERGGVEQEYWRPKAVYHYIQDRYLEPNLIIDISEHFETKMKAIMAFKSQFHNPRNEQDDEGGPDTPISSPEFLQFLQGRMSEFGRRIGSKYGEGFVTRRPLGVEDITKLL